MFGRRYPQTDCDTGRNQVADYLLDEELSAVSQLFATNGAAHCHRALGLV